MRLLEIGRDRIDHGITDLVERIHFGARLLLALRDRQRRIVKRIPGAIAPRERAGSRVAHMADAERIDEAFERDVAPAPDRGKQIAHRPEVASGIRAAIGDLRCSV